MISRRHKDKVEYKSFKDCGYSCANAAVSRREAAVIARLMVQEDGCWSVVEAEGETESDV
jgi:hypothetical protein